MPEHFSFRWGIPILDNLDHVTIYHFLLDHYADLGVTPLEMMFIIHLSQFRYESSKGKAAPALGTIAKLMGYKDEQPVRRLKNSLKHKKLLAVKDEPGRPNTYDFTAFAKKAFTLWQADHPQGDVDDHGSTVAHTDDTPIQIDRGMQRDRGIKSTPIQLDTPPLSHQIPEEIEENKNHESPPPTRSQPQRGAGGGGGNDLTETERLLLQFSPEPFGVDTAHEFRNLPPDLVRAELARARASRTGPGALVKRWRKVPPTDPPPVVAAPDRPPAKPLAPGVPVSQLREWRDKYEKEHRA